MTILITEDVISLDYSKGSHTVHDIKYHIIWVTKYRYKVLNKVTIQL